MKTSSKAFEIIRELDAPRNLVFSVFTEPQHLANWWGPAGLKVGVESLDLKPGGTFLYSMEAPDGNKLWGKFVYKEIVAPVKLSFTSGFCDASGSPQRPPMATDWPLEIYSVIHFEEQDGKTLLRMSGIPVNATEAEIRTFEENFGSMNQGWAGTFAKLEAYLGELN